MIVKIADFGMARYLSTGDYYHQSQWTVLPIKWMAPEGVNNRIFSEKSDVVSILRLVLSNMLSTEPVKL